MMTDKRRKELCDRVTDLFHDEDLELRDGVDVLATVLGEAIGMATYDKAVERKDHSMDRVTTDIAALIAAVTMLMTEVATATHASLKQINDALGDKAN